MFSSFPQMLLRQRSARRSQKRRTGQRDLHQSERQNDGQKSRRLLASRICGSIWKIPNLGIPSDLRAESEGHNRVWQAPNPSRRGRANPCYSRGLQRHAQKGAEDKGTTAEARAETAARLAKLPSSAACRRGERCTHVLLKAEHGAARRCCGPRWPQSGDEQARATLSMTQASAKRLPEQAQTRLSVPAQHCAHVEDGRRCAWPALPRLCAPTSGKQWECPLRSRC